MILELIRDAISFMASAAIAIAVVVILFHGWLVIAPGG
jgi:hypothetical protein